MQKRKQSILTPDQHLEEARLIGQYIIDNKCSTYDAAAQFNVSQYQISCRLKLLKQMDKKMYAKIKKICPRLGVVRKARKKKVQKPIYKVNTEPAQYVYSTGTGCRYIETGHKKTPKYKCKSISGRTKGGRWEYVVAAKYFFNDGYQRFVVKANSPKEAIEQVQVIIKHHKLKYLNPNACWIEGAN